MSRLIEKTIQDKALAELKKYYIERENLQVIFGEKEVCTRKEKGNKRADGLLSFHSPQQQGYTVSFEAKSHKTLRALISFVENERLGKHCVLSGVILALLSTAALYAFTAMPWYFLLLSGAGALFLFTLISIWVLDWLDLDLHRHSHVIRQLKQYPANEQWVVYSTYTYNKLAAVKSEGKKNHQQVFDSLCEKNGFGLLLISNQKSHIKLKPKIKKGAFLSSYCKEEEVLAFLKKETNKSSGETVLPV